MSFPSIYRRVMPVHRAALLVLGKNKSVNFRWHLSKACEEINTHLNQRMNYPPVLDLGSLGSTEPEAS